MSPVYLPGISHKKFFLLSPEHERPKDAEFSVPLWNFLFYLSLGFVIAFAIRMGGVLLVFSYLIVPPVSAMLLARKLRFVLLIAWFFAVLTSYFGLFFSFATTTISDGPAMRSMPTFPNTCFFAEVT